MLSSRRRISKGRRVAQRILTSTATGGGLPGRRAETRGFSRTLAWLDEPRCMRYALDRRLESSY